MHVKMTLDDALLEAGVKYLYSCYATDVVRDAEGEPCGVVMANRAGRQAVVAKTIIDATPNGLVARLAGARFRSPPSGPRTFKRVVIGGSTHQSERATARTISPPFFGPGGNFPIHEYTMTLDVSDDSYAAVMRADQQARTMTYDEDQQFTSDVLFEVPPAPMQGQETASESTTSLARWNGRLPT